MTTMTTMRTFALLLACTACAQERPNEKPPTGGNASATQDPAAAGRELAAEIKKQFEAEHIRVDAKARTVTIDAVMNSPPDPIEYLLIHRRGKRHEAVFVTKSKPSLLNAALLMIGLEPGKNATVTEKEPPPTLEQIQAGADPLIVTPPQGKQFWITVRFKDAEGKQVEHPVEDLIADIHAQEPVAVAEWIFLGGRMAPLYKNEPDVYVADFEGNLVSVCYLSPDNHLATMRHERARDDQNWWLTEFCPPPETPVEFVFHAEQPKISKERQERVAREAAAKPKTPGETEGKGEGSGEAKSGPGGSGNGKD